MSNKADQVVQVIADAGGPITGADVARALGYDSPQSISGVLTVAWREGRIKRVGRGLYEIGGPKVVGTIAKSQNIETTVGSNLLRNGDLFEYIASANSGALILRQIDSQALFVATILDV